MPRSAGKKGDIPPRKKRCPQTIQQYIKPTRPLLQSSASPTSSCATSMSYQLTLQTPTTASNSCAASMSYHVSHQTPTVASNNYIMNQQSVNLSSSQLLNSPIIQSPSSVFHSPSQNPSYGNFNFTPRQPIQATQFPLLQPASNPFILKFVGGNIRVCQSCRSSLRQADGSVLFPPNDLCVSRLERRPYWHEASRSWCSPTRESNSHYCVKLSCLQASSPGFVGASLVIPTEIAHQLDDIHRKYLAAEFSVNCYQLY